MKNTEENKDDKPPSTKLPITLAFLYNIRHLYPNPDNPLTFLEADFDDEKSIEYMIKHFQNCVDKIIPIESNLKAEDVLMKYRSEIDLAFNYSEVVYGTQDTLITSVLEKLDLPFTCTGDTYLHNINDKGTAQTILRQNGLPILPFQIFDNPDQPLHPDLRFPLIVKPIAEGSSAGITNKSVVNNLQQLTIQVTAVLKELKQRVIVEPFISGREFSVALLGNNPPKVLPIIESDHSSLPENFVHIDSLEVKWFYEEDNKNRYLICPADIEHKLKAEIEQMCLKTWDILQIKDFCRIDVRCDKNNQPYVLDINCPPGLTPPEISKTSYLPLIARTAGLDYENLLTTIIKIAADRLNIRKLVSVNN